MELVKILGQSTPTADTLTDAYVVPVLSQTTISSITVCNRSAGTNTFRISVAVAGAADAVNQYLYYDIAVPGNDTFTATIGITLQATDVVRVYASGSLSFNIFGIETIIDSDYTAILQLGGAVVSLPSDQSIPNSTLTQVTAGSIVVDSGGYWQVNKFKVPVGYGGQHTISAWSAWGANATGYRGLFLNIGGIYRGVRLPAANGSSTHQSTSITFDLSEGTEVTIHVDQTTGGNYNLLASGNTGFSIQRVGLALGTVPSGPITSSALTMNQNKLLGRVTSGNGPIEEIPFEEGTFTPTVTFETPGTFVPSYSLQKGYYQRIGKRIHFSAQLTWTANAYTGASGQIYFSGWPYATAVSFCDLFVVDLVTSNITWPNSNTQLFAVFMTSVRVGLRSIGSATNRSASWGTSQFPASQERAIVISGSYGI